MNPNVKQVEIVENDGGEWFFRAVAHNGEVVAVSEMYAARQSAVDEAGKLWPGSPVVDAPFDRSDER